MNIDGKCFIIYRGNQHLQILAAAAVAVAVVVVLACKVQLQTYVSKFKKDIKTAEDACFQVDFKTTRRFYEQVKITRPRKVKIT